MNNVPSANTLSSAIIRPLLEAYKMGGIALVFLIIGMLLMAFAFTLTAKGGSNEALTYGFLVTGIVCILAVIGIAYILVLVPINNTIKKARENEDALNSVQSAALTLSEINKELTTFVFLNTHALGQSFETIRSLLGKFPGANIFLQSRAFTSSEAFVKTLVTYASASRDMGSGIHDAIRRADAKEIRQYVERIAQLKEKTDEFFAKNHEL